jgi:hypothetical protein
MRRRFKLSPGGTLTVLHSFCSKPSCSDGAFPRGRLLADSKGNLYGATSKGGGSGCFGQGCGVVFKLSPPIPPATKWTETVLYSFKGGNDGASPQGSLLADSKGNLYGTTCAPLWRPGFACVCVVRSLVCSFM